MSARLVWIGLIAVLGLQAAGCNDAAKTDDTAVATVSPSGTIAVTLGTSQSVTATFTTSDGNAASSLSISSTALSALPTGWSSSADSLFCAAFAAGDGCQLTLTYAPSSASNGTLSLPYTYDNDEGQSETGTLNIVYTSSAPTYAYVTDQSIGGTGVYLCTLGSTGGLSACTETGDVVSNATSLALYGSTAYIGDYNGNLYLCAVAADGDLSACSETSTPFPGNLTVNGNWLYYPTPAEYGGPEVCVIGSAGALSDCTSTDAVSSANQATGLAFYDSTAYVSTSSSQGLPGVLVCTYSSNNGSVSNCVDSGTSIQDAQGLVVSQNRLYVVFGLGQSIDVCTIGSTGALSGCSSSAPFSLGSGWEMTYQPGLAISGGHAYLPYYATDLSQGGTRQSGVAICTVTSNGGLSACVDSGIAFDEAASVTLP